MKYLAYLTSLVIIFTIVICAIVLGILPVYEKTSVFISGQYSSDLILESIDGEDEKINLQLKGETDSYLAKYNEDGVVKWASLQFSTTENKKVNVSNITDHSSGVYICGNYDANMIAGSGYGLNNQKEIEFDSDYKSEQSFFAKYDKNGKVLWTARNISIDSSSCDAVTCDKYDNVYITGTHENVIILESSSGNCSRTLIDYPGIYIAKYDKYGDIIWAANISATEREIKHLGIDSKDNIYLTGNYKGSSITFTSAAGQEIIQTLPNSSQWDGFLAKYNKDGKVIWSNNQYDTDGTGDTDNSYLAIDLLNNIYIVGQFQGKLNLDLTSSTGIKDSYIAKYDEYGSFLWSARQGASNDSSAMSAGIDRNDNVYIAGFFDSDITFYPAYKGGNTQILTTTYGSYFLAKYKDIGEIVWSIRIGPRYFTEIGITLDKDNNIYLTGVYNDSITMESRKETGVLNSNGENGFITKYNSKGDFEWAANQLNSSHNRIS